MNLRFNLRPFSVIFLAKHTIIGIHLAWKHAQTPDRSDFDYAKIWPIWSLSMNLISDSKCFISTAQGSTCTSTFQVKCFKLFSVDRILLFISYKFVKGFLAISFLLLIIFSWNFHFVCQRFLYNQKKQFSLIRQETKIFPIDPIIKIAHFCNSMSIDMPLQKWVIFIMGVYGEIPHFLSDPTKISFQSTVHTKL